MLEKFENFEVQNLNCIYGGNRFGNPCKSEYEEEEETP